MKFQRLVNAIEKAGMKVVPAEHTHNMYRVEGPKNYYGTFHQQMESAICVSVCRKGEGPDAMTDHFPQTYCSTIKSFVSWVQE